MQEWPDDHLDDLFRKSAEEFDVPFDPAHWTDLTNRLDDHDRQGFYDRWRIWGGATVLTGLLLVTLWWAWKVTTVAASPVAQKVVSEQVDTKLLPAKSTLTTSVEAPDDQKNSAPEGTETANRPTDSRPTPGVVKKPVATPDWAVRSRETAGQWRRRAATNEATTSTTKSDELTQKQPNTQGETTLPTSDKPLVKRPLAAKSTKRPAADENGTTKAATPDRTSANRPVAKEADDENELIVALNKTSSPASKPAASVQATTREYTDNQPVVNRRNSRQSQPKTAKLARPTWLAGQLNSTEKTTTNEHRSDRSPEITSSTNTPAQRSGGFSDQAQPINQTSPQPVEPVAGGITQPAELTQPDRLLLSTVSPAFSLTAVKTARAETPQEPVWEDFDHPAQRVAMPRQRFSVMAVYSPDLSAIGLRDFTRPGSNYGVMAQYRLSNRFSLQTGALISTKKYQTSSEYYVWPTSWARDPWPSDINGTCTMIDVPLNVRYDWLLRPKGDGRMPARWFASTGLTSYFIRREIYTYDYADPSDPRIKYLGWDNQKAGVPGGKFGFSNLNVSVGYEHPIGRHLSWQVEPFMKIPLQQVGFFKVRLLSTGAFIGLKYSL